MSSVPDVPLGEPLLLMLRLKARYLKILFNSNLTTTKNVSVAPTVTRSVSMSHLLIIFLQSGRGALINSYKAVVEKELQDTCNEVLNLLEVFFVRFI
jgi:hypothetical protein